MKELRSKRSGKISILSDEEYDLLISSGQVPIKNFIVNDIKVRKITPPLTEINEVKPKKRINEN